MTKHQGRLLHSLEPKLQTILHMFIRESICKMDIESPSIYKKDGDLPRPLTACRAAFLNYSIKDLIMSYIPIKDAENLVKALNKPQIT